MSFLASSTLLLNHLSENVRASSVKPGDRLICQTGKPSTVTRIEKRSTKCVQINPIKGSSFIIGIDSPAYLLCIDKFEGKPARSPHYINPSKLLLYTSVKRFKMAHTIAEFDEMKLPIDPYVYGYYLIRGSNHMLFEVKKPAVIEELKRRYEPGFKASKYSKDKIAVKNPAEFKALLRDMSIAQIRISSLQQRLDWLAGVFDATGYNLKCTYELCHTNEEIMREVVHIVKTCGFSAYIGESGHRRYDKKNHKFRRSTRYFISGQTHLIPTVSKPHKKACERDMLMCEFSIEEVDGEIECVSIVLENGERLVNSDMMVV